MQSKLLKNPNIPSLSRIGKSLEVYTAQEQHFKIEVLNLWMNWENKYPNLSVTIDNKMGNLHKEKMVAF